jgi:hypothetical protein
MFGRDTEHYVKHGTDGRCFICGEKTNSLNGNPAEWPNFFPYPNGNGKWRRYCTGCVIDKLNAGSTESKALLENA